MSKEEKEKRGQEIKPSKYLESLKWFVKSYAKEQYKSELINEIEKLRDEFRNVEQVMEISLAWK